MASETVNNFANELLLVAMDKLAMNAIVHNTVSLLRVAALASFFLTKTKQVELRIIIARKARC